MVNYLNSNGLPDRKLQSTSLAFGKDKHIFNPENSVREIFRPTPSPMIPPTTTPKMGKQAQEKSNTIAIVNECI